MTQDEKEGRAIDMMEKIADTLPDANSRANFWQMIWMTAKMRMDEAGREINGPARSAEYERDVTHPNYGKRKRGK